MVERPSERPVLAYRNRRLNASDAINVSQEHVFSLIQQQMVRALRPGFLASAEQTRAIRCGASTLDAMHREEGTRKNWICHQKAGKIQAVATCFFWLGIFVPLLFRCASSDMDQTSSNDDVSRSCERGGSNDFRELLGRARGGSTAALGEMVQTCRDYLLLVANQEITGPLRQKFNPSDAVQETFLLAQRRLEQFRGDSQEELLAWLRAILRNQILAENRRQTASKRDYRRELRQRESGSEGGRGVVGIGLAGDHMSPRSEAIHAEEAVRLRQALAGLSTDHRCVIVLRNWEQLAFSEVARRMNRSEDATKKLWTRAMRGLEKALRDEAEREPL